MNQIDRTRPQAKENVRKTGISNPPQKKENSKLYSENYGRNEPEQNLKNFHPDTETFQKAPVGFLLVDSNNGIIEINTAACRLFEKEKSTVLEWGFPRFINPDSWDSYSKFFNALKKGNYQKSCDIKLNNSHSNYVRVTGWPGEKVNDTNLYRLLLFDVTKEKDIEIKLAKSLELQKNNHLKTEFLASMSHDIRTPMNAILGFSDLLKEPELSKENLKKYINLIQNSGNQMLDIIYDLIDISKIETDSVKTVKIKTNLNELLQYVYATFHPEAEKRSLELILRTPDSGNLLFETDPEKVFVVFTNLIKNALRFTKKGHIVFGFREKDDGVEFFVEDTGTGIAGTDQKEIFGRFYKGRSNKKSRESSGLGLSISRAYVELMGGTIDVISKPGKGSHFFFSLPGSIYAGEIAGKETDSVNSFEDKLKMLSILVAEDDEVARIYLTELLKGKCKKLLFAKNGKEAVEFYQTNDDIDLVLMDIKMPVMDGYSATIKIKEFDKQAIIIAQTAYALASDREKALAAGCSDYMTKPIMKKVLYAVIEKYFR